MNPAVHVEATKLARSLVGRLGSAILVGGLAAICLGLLAAIRSGDPQLTAKLGPSATFDWAGLTSSAAQVTGAGGLLGFGVVLAWIFAREFADGTITGLFGLPVGRGRIAAAKLVVYAGWSTVVSLACAAAVTVIGLGFGLGLPDASAWAALGRQVVLGMLTAALALPVAWASTAGRSLLAGVTTAVGLVIVAQVGVLAGAGGWMPLAAPALWAIGAGPAISTGQLGMSLALGLAFAAVTVASWHRLQLDR